MSANLTPEDVEYLREGYRLFRDHEPAFMDRFAPDATFAYPTTLPAGGIYVGPWEVLEFTTTVSDSVDDPHPQPEEFIRDGDRLVVLGHFHGRSRATCEQVAIRFAHVARLTAAEGPLSGQRYAAFELLVDTAAVVAAINGQDAG